MFLASSSTAPSAPVLLTYTTFQDITKGIFKKYRQHLRENLRNFPTYKSVPLRLPGTHKQTLSQTLCPIHYQFLTQNSVCLKTFPMFLTEVNILPAKYTFL